MRQRLEQQSLHMRKEAEAEEARQVRRSASSQGVVRACVHARAGTRVRARAALRVVAQAVVGTSALILVARGVALHSPADRCAGSLLSQRIDQRLQTASEVRAEMARQRDVCRQRLSENRKLLEELHAQRLAARHKVRRRIRCMCTCMRTHGIQAQCTRRGL